MVHKYELQSAEVSFVLSQFTRLTDRQTDRRTDGRTDGQRDRHFSHG